MSQPSCTCVNPFTYHLPGCPEFPTIERFLPPAKPRPTDLPCRGCGREMNLREEAAHFNEKGDPRCQICGPWAKPPIETVTCRCCPKQIMAPRAVRLALQPYKDMISKLPAEIELAAFGYCSRFCEETDDQVRTLMALRRGVVR